MHTCPESDDEHCRQIFLSRDDEYAASFGVLFFKILSVGPCTGEFFNFKLNLFCCFLQIAFHVVIIV